MRLLSRPSKNVMIHEISTRPMRKRPSFCCSMIAETSMVVRSANVSKRYQNRVILRHCDHDLADLLVGFEILVRFNGFHKGKTLGDLRHEAAVRQAVENVLRRRGEQRRIRRDLVQRITPDAQSLAKHGEQGERSGIARKRPIFENDAASCRSLS